MAATPATPATPPAPFPPPPPSASPRPHATGGSGLAFTLGGGNETVATAIKVLAQPLIGLDIETVMADFGARWRAMANHPTWRWLGPEKGNVHLALAAISNACFDLWAKARGMPLWQLLLSLTPEEVRGWGDSGERCHVAAGRFQP
ncbi:MAG: hypothetical protein CMA55_02475 [Euryarchaeota archaeon]|nr:hypothetical protein [Euryarchaeota archaeon]